MCLVALVAALGACELVGGITAYTYAPPDDASDAGPADAANPVDAADTAPSDAPLLDATTDGPPTADADADAGDGRVAEVVASGLSHPNTLVAAPGYLFWFDGVQAGNNDTLYRATFDGGARFALATGLQGAKGLAVDEQSVFWSNAPPGNAGTINQAPLGGGATTVLQSGVYAPGLLALAGTSVYYVFQSPNATTMSMIGTATKGTAGTGSPTANIIDPTTTSVLATTVSDLIVLDSIGGLSFVFFLGGVPTSFYFPSNAGPALGLAVDSSNMYWVSAPSTPSGYPTTVWTAGIDGGGLTMLDQGPPADSAYTPAFFADTADVYYTERVNGVTQMWRVAKTGGAPVRIGDYEATSIAVYANYIYWTDGTAGAVVRMPK
jgi:hypothetical protein